MPYIELRRRPYLTLDSESPAQTVGELNFQITQLCDRYIKRAGLRYDAINAAIGALECAKLELYRRVAAPYEDTKIQQNGDVYETAKR